MLAAFSGERSRMTQADLARELGLSRATVRRAVLTLEHLGYLTAEGRSYELSPRVLRLATGYLTSNVISAVVQPACEQVCDRVQASCSAAVLEGADAVMIARAVPHHLVALGTGVGYRVPASSSSLGQVLLANVGRSGDRGDIASATADLTPDRLATVRAEGYSYVANDVEADFHSIAVPLRRWDGRVVAAMNVGATMARVSAEQMHGEVLELLLATADELNGQLI